MKLIHTGKKPKKYQWQGVYLCGHCGTVMGIGEDDADEVKNSMDNQRDGMSVTIHCPICEQTRSLMDFRTTTTYRDNRNYWDTVLMEVDE